MEVNTHCCVTHRKRNNTMTMSKYSMGEGSERIQLAPITKMRAMKITAPMALQVRRKKMKSSRHV